MKNSISIISLLALTGMLYAQQPQSAPVSKKAEQQRRTETRAGNKAFNHKQYDEATKHYNQALAADSTYYKAQYNMGNTMYRQRNYARANECYTNALQNPSLKPSDRSRIHYNLGNSQLQNGLQKRKNFDPQQGQDNGMQDFQQAVNNYKEALKINPKNQDAKYNLSYAMKMLQQAQQQQQQQKGGGGGGQNDKKDQQKDKQQNQGQGQQNQDNKQNQNKGNNSQQNPQQNPKDDNGQGNKDQQQKQKQQQQQQQAKEQQKKQAEQLLNAVKNNEKQTMKEQMKAKEAKVDGRIEKQW